MASFLLYHTYKESKVIETEARNHMDHTFKFQTSNEQEETAMLKINDIDFPLEVVMELRETYPDEVLKSEWNPVIAQMNLHRRQGRTKERGNNMLRLAIPGMDLPEYKP